MVLKHEELGCHSDPRSSHNKNALIFIILLQARLNLLDLLQPCARLSIRRHVQVAAWREAYSAHLWTIGHCRTLELLREEATEEDLQPLKDFRLGVLILESETCKHKYF